MGKSNGKRKNEDKLYTAQEIIDRIEKGWKSEKELKELYEFIENAKMKNEEELEKLCDSGYTNLVYNSYEAE